MLGDDKVDAALADPEATDLPVKVKAMMRLLTKVTKEHGALTADDVAPVLAAGVSRDGVQEALAIGWAFNVITRIADALEFEVGSRAFFDAGAKMLLTRGYK